MSITLKFGWWLIPAALTAALFLWATRYTVKRGPLTGDYDFGVDIMFVYLVAMLGSAMAWALFFAVLYFTKP